MHRPHDQAKAAHRQSALLLTLSLLVGLAAVWQWVLFAQDNSFLDGICSGLGARDLAPEARAVRLFQWATAYDDHIPPTESAAPPLPYDLVTPRSIVEHRAYFRDNCGSTARLLAALAGRAGLDARALHLCDAAHITRHVVCEVRLGSRWVVFDPTLGLAFRRRDGRLATAAELRDPALLAANTARFPQYRRHGWRFDHAERLHFEKLPVLGRLLRGLAPHLTGRPAEDWALPAALDRPRLLAAGGFAALSLLTLAAAGQSTRRLTRETRRRAPRTRLSCPALARETEQD